MYNEGVSYDNLQVQPESHEVIACPSNFWDLEEGCRIGVKWAFEYVSRRRVPHSCWWWWRWPFKAARVGDDAHIFYLGLQDILDGMDLEIIIVEPNIIPTDSLNIALYSKMNGSGIDEKILENPLESELINKETMELYLKVLQPLLMPVNYVDHFLILAKVTSANPSHSTMQMISPQYRGPF